MITVESGGTNSMLKKRHPGVWRVHQGGQRPSQLKRKDVPFRARQGPQKKFI